MSPQPVHHFYPTEIDASASKAAITIDTASILLLMCCLLLPTATKRKVCLEGESVQTGPMGHECRNYHECMM